MSEIYTLTKQISRSNYQLEDEFISKIKMVIRDHYENYPFQHEEFRERFKQNELLDIIMYDIVNFWEDSVELGFDFADYEAPEDLINAVIQTINALKENVEFKKSNIVVKLNTYLLSFVSFDFSA
jgi:hypothetical protein